MQINSLNHRNENSRLFGLLPDFLTYRTKTKETNVETRDQLADKEALVSDKEVREAEKKYEALKKAVSLKIKVYNNSTNENYSVNRPQEAPLSTDVDNLRAIVDQIDKLLRVSFVDEFGKRITILSSTNKSDISRKNELLKIRASITGGGAEIYGQRKIFIDKDFIAKKWNRYFQYGLDSFIDPDRAPFYKNGEFENAERALNQLMAIRTQMWITLQGNKNHPDYKQLYKAYEQVGFQIELLKNLPSRRTIQEAQDELQEKQELAAKESKKYLVDTWDQAEAAAKTKSKLQQKEPYTKASDMYDLATKSPVISAGSDEFKNFWTNPEYGVSTSDRAESKNLFFSILQRETNNFENSFILGDDFQEDHEKNRKNFPFIYQEWLKYKNIDPKEINRYDEKVAEIQSRVASVNSVEDIITTMNQTRYKISLDKKRLDNIPLAPRTKAFEVRADVINHYQHQLKEKLQSGDNLDNHKAIQEAIDALELHKQLAKAEYYREKLVESKTDAGLSFTRSSLQKNSQLVMELAMRKFRVAMKMVDTPDKHGYAKNAYNPTVRRFLISNIYESGVSEFRIDFGKGGTQIDKYIDNLKIDTSWMLAEVSKSPYYSRVAKGEKISENAEKLLPIMHSANKVATDLNKIKQVNKVLEEAMKWHSEPDTAKKDQIKDSLYKKYPQDINMIDTMLKQTPEDLKETLNKFTKIEEQGNEFLRKVQVAIKNPNSKDAKELIKAVEEGVKYSSIISPETLKSYEKQMKQVEVDFRSIELDEKSRMDYMERLGINTEGVYLAYNAFLNSLPVAERYSYSVNNWDSLMTSKDPKEFAKLTHILDQIIPKNDKEGRKHFLKVFGALHGDSFQDVENIEDSKAYAIGIYRMIKGEIHDREIGAAMSKEKQAEYYEKIDGETTGDKVTRYAKGAFNMLFGPGQSWANRGAGLVMMIAALKAAHSAYKGETKMGKALRIAFLLGATDLALKEITGKSGAERLGFETVMEAGEGTSEAVLVEDGAEHMKEKDISPEEHTRALYELRKVPFRDVMKWYRHSNTNKENGMPISEDKDDAFPDGIDLSNIVIGEKWENYDEDVVGRKVVMQTMKHFFEYAGRKEGLDPQTGADMLNERWVDAIKPGADPNKRKYSRFSIPEAARKAYQNNPDELTWGVVIDAEIDEQAKKDTLRSHGAAPVLDYFAEKGSAFVKWARQEVWSPVSDKMRAFGEGLGDKTGKVLGVLNGLAEKGKTLAHFTGEKIELEWEEHKLEIRKFAGDNLELIWEGVKFFPSAIIAFDQWAVPEILAKIQQFKEIMVRDQNTILRGETLSAKDIIGDDLLLLDPDFKRQVDDLRTSANLSKSDAVDQVITGMSAEALEEARDRAMKHPRRFSLKENPEFANYGIYQSAFAEAMNHETPDGHYFFKTPEEMNLLYPDTGIGYLITTTTQEQAEIAQYGEHDAIDRYGKINIKAREQAIEYFLGQNYNLDRADVERMMFPIHKAVKSGNYPPEIMYTFWRMPLPGSPEYELKSTNRWADKMRPEKSRPPIYINKADGIFGNLKKTVNIQSPAGKSALRHTARIAAQAGKFFALGGETVGSMFDWVLNREFIRGRGEEKTDFFENLAGLEPVTKEDYDELTYSASDRSYALSDFYGSKEFPDRNTKYMALIEFADEKNQKYYFGDIIPGRQGRLFNEQPDNWNTEEWEMFYADWCDRNNYNVDGTRKGISAEVAGDKNKKKKKKKKKK
ncbi:hypothetical protein JW758_06255 [Candidatus Peregrinibacteria bacterium]|nr:hypothetical protein [Candidatus Peregrinibacteria bacterium]